MYTDEDGELAVRIARDTVERFLKGKEEGVYEVPEIFRRPAGTFVTINAYPSGDLRGCIGYPRPIFPLIESLVRSAQEACRDPRFVRMPLTERDLPHITIEVSLLTPPEKIKVNRPDEYVGRIKVGRHGLIATMGAYRGLLLPQVPVEWGWDAKTFLEQTCMKAGLPPNAWKKRGFELSAFEAEVFTETEPYGDVIRKRLED